MNNRIAKKILTQVSSLHLSEKSVIKARKQAAKNRGYFKGKAIYLWPTLFSPR
jgi:hypothetical protein